MKLSPIGTLVLVIGLNAAGQSDAPSGTIIVVNASQHELVIVADSRENGTNSYDDEDCKISAFGNKFVFTASNRVGRRNDPNSKWWDSHAIAKKQFAIGIRKHRADDLTASELARDWAIAIKKDIEQRLAAPKAPLLAGLDDNRIVYGFFGRITPNGIVDAASETISYTQPETGRIVINTPDPRSLRVPEDFPQTFGRADIIKEIGLHSSVRGDEWNRRMREKMKSSSDPTLTQALELVRVTIDNLPPDRTDNKGKPFSVVGYPISGIRFTNNGIEWTDKGNCPQP